MVSAMDSIQFIPPDPQRSLIDALCEGAAEITARLAMTRETARRPMVEHV
jgi:hypothetical protein